MAKLTGPLGAATAAPKPKASGVTKSIGSYGSPAKTAGTTAGTPKGYSGPKPTTTKDPGAIKPTKVGK